MPKAIKNIKKYLNNPPSKAGGSKNKVEGPGIWVTCVKGKEKQTVGELYDLFESLAAELYPDEKDDSTQAATAAGNRTEAAEDDEDDLEKVLAKELKELTQSRQNRRFANARTDIACAVYISCRPPIDPVKIVYAHFSSVERTGLTQTRYALRFTPVSDSCAATLPNIIGLADRLFPPAFHSDPPRGYKYRIQITSRNHSAVSRNELIPALAKCVPADRGHTVDLDKPDLTILVELYMFVCGMSIVRDFDRLKKFNAVSVADAAKRSLLDAEQAG